MRTFETKIQELKTAVLTEVARLTWEDRLQTGTAILDIPEKIIPGPTATLRCCIYKERAIINSRVKLAMGGDKSNPCLVEVLPIACDECPVTEITVGPSCRGCLATRCVHACPKDAITIVNHRACIDHEKCISCGRCVSACQYSAILKTQRPCEKGCPAKAISMGPDRKASIDVSQCIACGNCVYQCPFGAIQDKSFITDAIHMIMGAEHWGYKTYAVLAPSIVGQFAPASYGQVVAGLKKLGFNGVAEVALGADMVADRESEELVEKGMLCSSCCPGFVGYIKKKHLEMENLISRTPSPMVMIGLHIKEKDPDAKVIFIGPCVAKKKEFQLGRTMNAIDCALTYEELFAMFESRGIDLESLEEAFKDGVKLFLFSNPNNPVGCVYSYEEITGIAALAKKYEVTLIVDELYSRQVYPGVPYTHLCAQKEIPENLITILGPSKTESLSGFRLGAAFDRKTGEALEPQELFTCSPEALITDGKAPGHHGPAVQRL